MTGFTFLQHNVERMQMNVAMLNAIMQPNYLYWITDRTPHESLPLKEEKYRQYFRLVTHEVSLWVEDHSAKNPLGLVPDSSITKIIKGSKFGDPRKLRMVSDYKQQVPLGNVNVVQASINFVKRHTAKI